MTTGTRSSTLRALRSNVLLSTALSLATVAALLSLLAAPAARAIESDAATARAPGSSEPQRVGLSSFKAFDAGGQVLVKWETGFEAGALGFELFREAGGQWLKVSEGLVPAQDAMVGGRYELLDAGAEAPGSYRYRLSVTLNTGRAVDLKTEELKATELVDPVTVVAQRSEAKTRPAIPVEVQSRAGVGLASPPPPVDLADPASHASVKITTTKPARVCFVSEASLATLLNQSIATVHAWITSNPGKVALYNRQQQVTYIPGAAYLDASHPTAPGFFFYAEGNVNNYTYDNAYWLKAGNNSYATLNNGVPATAPATDYYWAVYDQESDTSSAAPDVFDPEADFWVLGSVLSQSTASTWTSSTFYLYGLVRTAGLSATLKLRLLGGSETPHRVRVSMVDPTAPGGAITLGEQSFSGRVSAELQFSLSSTVLKDLLLDGVENQLRVEEVSNPTVSRVYVDGFELTYPRTYYTLEGSLEASENGHANIGASEFSSYVPTVFDITSPKQMKSMGGVQNTDLGGGVYKATFRTSPGGRYVIFQPIYDPFSIGEPPFSTPKSIALTYPAGLSDPATRASYVIITTASLLPGANQMAAYRNSAFRTKTVLLDDIYNEFSDGLTTPHAIEDFLRTAYQQWSLPPRYVLLLGDGSYDYRGITGYGDNLVPPLMIRTDFGLHASDSLYGKVSGDLIPRVFIGRIPVVNSAQLSAVLAKIQGYESQTVSAPLRAMLTADRPDAAGDFVANITAVASELWPKYDTNRLYYPSPYPVGNNPPPIDPIPVRAAIVSALNEGVDLMEYVGHGSQTRLGVGGYLRVSDVPTLAANQRLPIMAVMTCVVGEYSGPGFPCLAEVMVTTAGRGAVAALAPTGLSYDEDADWINRRFVEGLKCNRSGRLGDIAMQSFALYNQGPVRATPVWMYNILGDPAMKVLATAP